MSLFSVQARKHTTYYDHLMSTSRTPGRERLADRKSTEGKGERTSGESVCDESRSSDKSHTINRTYVISAMSKSGGGGGGPHTPYRGRLTLQRRSRRKTGAEAADKRVSDNSQNCRSAAPEKRLTLQRRTRTPSMDKVVGRQRESSGTDPQPTPKVLSEPNGRTPVLIRSMSLKSDPRAKDKVAISQGKPASSKTPSRCPSSAHRQLLEEQAQTFKTPTKKTPFEKIAAKRDVFEKLAQKEAPRPTVARSASLQRGVKSRLQLEEKTPVPAPRTTKAACAGAQRSLVAKTSTSSGLQAEATQASCRTSAQGSAAPVPTEQQSSRTTEALRVHDSFKMENSAVTVAVRVRPFNARLVGFGCVALQHGKR